mgnify:CR=1 FL=1
MPKLAGNIRVFNGDFIVLADFRILKNSVIFAKNGSGKTTFLKGLAGLLKTEGELYLGGERINGKPPEKRGIVYINQDPALPIRVAKFAKLMKCEDEVQEVLGPDFPWNRKLGELSLGQRQKVVVACSLLSRRPRSVVLLDESVDNLSDRLDFLKWVLEVAKKRDRIVIYATNNPAGLEMFEQYFTLRDRKLLEVENHSLLTG